MARRALLLLFVVACGDNTVPKMDPCDDLSCDVAPAPSCAGDLLTTYAAPGTCSTPNGVAACAYSSTTTNCASSGMVCSNGACVEPTDPCATTTCNTPPADDCTGTTKNDYPATGTCSSTSGSAVCSYTPTTTNCATTNQACSAGACVDPCVGFTCNMPPASTCATGVFTMYSATGTCSSPGGVPQCSYTPAQMNCTTMNLACDTTNGCVDPCVGMTCTMPPANTCVGGTFTTYAATGTCSSPGGVAQCGYAPTTTNCAAMNLACDTTNGCVDPCIGVTCNMQPPDACVGGMFVDYQPTGTCSSPGGVQQCNYGPVTTNCTAMNQACSPTMGCFDACTGITCNMPPADSCAGGVFTDYQPTGTCVTPGGTCDYAPTTTNCAAMNQACSPTMGCVDPCAGVTCDMPPTSTCNAGVFTTYAATGTCSSPGGVQQCNYAPTNTDCAAIDQACNPMSGCFDPCAGVTCDTPPATSCANGTLTTYAPTGTCSSPGGVAQCNYTPTTTNCAAMDLACDAPNATCDDPCAPNPCTTPPANTCAMDTLTTFANPGTCSSPAGNVQCNYTPTMTDCAATMQICQNGACVVDPCAGVTCNMPPADTCVGNVATDYPASGTCNGGTCDYTPTTTDCASTSQICLNASCVTPLDIGFCRVQFPDSITDRPGLNYTVFGRVYAMGLTDTTGMTDVDPRLRAEFGYGPGLDPTNGYTWQAATANTSYGPGSPGYEANNDEYQSTWTIPNSPGSRIYYAYRFSGDAGQTWTYCDTGNEGNTNGLANLGLATVVAPYFSEYMEGSSNNKAIEIYNPGATAFPLAGCSVGIYFNGVMTRTNIMNLTTMTVTSIAPGDVYVLCHSSYSTTLGDVAQCDQLNGNASWNGDDAIDLQCNGVTYDIVGQIGLDPGTEWGAGNQSTADNTLVRVCTTLTGDRNGGDAFVPAAEWAGYPQDSHFIGSRSCPLPP